MREITGGYCPMGCGETLYLSAYGYITCSLAECPRPDAACDLLADRETEHLVDLKSDTFTIRHPLRERLDDALMACQLDVYIASFDGPPLQPGRYRVAHDGANWGWESTGTFQRGAELTTQAEENGDA